MSANDEVPDEVEGVRDDAVASGLSELETPESGDVGVSGSAEASMSVSVERVVVCGGTCGRRRRRGLVGMTCAGCGVWVHNMGNLRLIVCLLVYLSL